MQVHQTETVNWRWPWRLDHKSSGTVESTVGTVTYAVRTKWLAVFSNHPDAEDAKLTPVRMASPCARGDRYGSWSGSPTLRAANVSTSPLVQCIRGC